MEDNNTIPTGEELMTELGVSTTPPPAADPPAQDPPASEPKPDPQQNRPEDMFHAAKENNAFAQMRLQNKQYSEFIGKIAGALNLNSTDPEAIMATMQKTLLEKEAENKKLPVEVLERMQKLEEQAQTYQANELKQSALLGFNAVKEQFKLSDKDLMDFATKLNEQGLNPFTEKVDLITQYKIVNFDKLMADAEKRGIQQENDRAGKAAQHSTQPGSTVGGVSNPATGINSLNDLNSFLDTQTKK